MQKTIEELLAEKQANEQQIEQLRHRGERLENRERHLAKGERTKRTHRRQYHEIRQNDLCFIGSYDGTRSLPAKLLTHMVKDSEESQN